MRVPVRSSGAQPLEIVSIGGWRDMHCAPALGLDRDTGLPARRGGDLSFKHHLFVRLSQMNAAAMRVALQRAEASTTRADQYRELFGVELPAESGELHTDPPRILNYAERTTLNLGQELSLSAFSVRTDNPDSNPNFECLSPAQVDAAIAEAKRVYAAVIMAMEGGGSKGGLTATPSTGLQTENPRGK
jgi:hypothetical protein